MSKNTLNIIRSDFSRLTRSIVPIIVLLGLCIVPCLYAWFNIFSNWNPYTAESTGRIEVAVANEDQGADLLGLNINVGEKITEELKANSDIGWIIVSSDEKALEGLYAGDYYAAVVIPEDFSSNVMSFTSGELNNPQMDYYENVKKNALAPKITGKAESVLRDEVNAAFIDTIGRYVSEAKAVADAAGLDPVDVFADLSSRLGELSERMDDLLALVKAARGLSDAADELLQASGNLTDSTESALSSGKNVIKNEKEFLPETDREAKRVSEAVKKESKILKAGLGELYDALSAVSNDMDAFNQFVTEDLQAHRKRVSDMADSTETFAKRLSDLGLSGLAARFERLSRKLNNIADALNTLTEADETTWPQIQEQISGFLEDIRSAEDMAGSISEDAGTGIDSAVAQTVNDTRKAIRDIQDSISESYGSLDSLSDALAKSEKALDPLNGGLSLSVSSLMDMRSGFGALSGLFDSLANNEDVNSLNALLTDGTEVIAEKLAKPIEMKTEVVYPVRNFGSMMAPFYTILSQWVAALFAAVLIRARIRRRDDEAMEGGPTEQDNRLREPGLLAQYFGRFRLFLLIGLVQALIVSLGDLLYVGIQCHHPALFVLAACVNAFVFMMINYALIFVLGKIGAAVSVIIVILQVAGTGGTFPPEVLPGIFRTLYPFMPFKYSLAAMRECVAGMYGSAYWINIGVLILIGVIAAAAGLLLSKPGQWLTGFLNRGMEKSDLLEG